MKFKLLSGMTNDYSEDDINSIRESINDSDKQSKPGHTRKPCKDFTAEKPQRTQHNNCVNCGTSELLHAVFGGHPNHQVAAWDVPKAAKPA